MADIKYVINAKVSVQKIYEIYAPENLSKKDLTKLIEDGLLDPVKETDLKVIVLHVNKHPDQTIGDY